MKKKMLITLKEAKEVTIIEKKKCLNKDKENLSKYMKSLNRDNIKENTQIGREHNIEGDKIVTMKDSR